jgi:hypothetical protein
VETVKAVINIGEASIQLEGPRDFVEKYLEKYGYFVEKWQKSPPASGKTTVEDKVKGKPAKTKRPRLVAKSGCSERIRALISENYFVEPRTSNEVMIWLKDQKSVTYKINQVAAALSTIIKSKSSKLRRFKEDGVYKYCNV